MQDRDYFFKPYRQRINDMYQQHDSLDDEEYESPTRKSYTNYSPAYFDINRPWTQQSPNIHYSPSQRHQSKSNSQKKKMKQYNYNSKRKHTKLGREMHQPVWQHLYNMGIQNQKQIEEAHKLKQFQIDTQCTFQPMIRKSSRYRLPTTSNFLQRNYIWQQNKLQKIVKQKQEQVTKGLQECTFKPKLNKYYKVTNKQYHHLNPSKSMVKLQNRNRNQNIQKPAKEKLERDRKTGGGFNGQQVGKIKNLIRNQLKRIQL